LLEDSASPVERALLEAGASYRSSASVHAKTLAAVGIAGSAVIAETAGATISNFGWSKWLTSLSVVGTTAAIPVGYYVLQDPTPAPIVVQQPAPRTARVVPPAPPEPLEVETSIPPSVAPPVVAKAEPRRVSPGPSLAAETGAVDAARSLLLRGDARGALAALDAYARAYPRGRLGLEAEVLRIDALDRSGQSDAAKRRAEAFLRQHPKSVLAARVRRILGN
jgi:hypothetical protein